MNRLDKITSTRLRGFSLVELSIVLVILGLLVGGVLSGQSLIKAAEARSLLADITRWRTATMTFRDKYFYYPGDMPNATSFWGVAGGSTGSDVACYDTISTDARTCNGNGDGAIGAYNYSMWESYRFWQHLANTGMIEGNYTGVGANYSGPNQSGCLPGTNCPKLRTRNASALPVYQNSDGDADFVYYPLANYWLVGASTQSTFIGMTPIAAIVDPQEAWNIDTKIDDGLPYTGFMQTNYRTGSGAWGAQTVNNCASSSVIAGATYNLALRGAACAFRISFN